MRIIDSHNHVYYHGLGPSGVVGELDAFGIERAWILTWYLPPGEHVPSSHRTFNPRNARTDGTHGGSTFDDVIEALQRYPDRFVGGYCPCPHEGDAADIFEAAYEMHGVRVCGEWSYRMLLDDPRAILLFRRAGELKCPVVLHLDVPFRPHGEGGQVYATNWYGGGAAPLERTLQACPDTIFVGHAPGFWRFLSGDEGTESATYPTGPVTPGGDVIRLLDTYDNLWAALSAGSGLGAMRRDMEHAHRFIETYQDRLMFGRDAPGDDLRPFLLEEMDLSDEIRRKLLYENAIHLVPASDG
mgnify:FL=1